MSKGNGRTRTEAALTLAEELTALLREREIPYITGGLLARAVFEKGKRVFPCLDLYIYQGDMDTLVSIVENALRHDRAIERIIDDETVFQGSLRYVDTTTTLIDSYDMVSVKKMGIHIRVIPLKDSEHPDFFLAPNANGYVKEISKKQLRETEEYKYEGLSFDMPVHLKDWYEFLFEKDGSYTFPSYNNVRCIVSTTVGYGSIVSSLKNWTELSREMDAAAKSVDETTKRIDERDKVLNGVMDALRVLYEKDETCIKKTDL